MRQTKWFFLAVMALVTAVQGQEEMIGTWQNIEAEPEQFTLRFAADGSFEMILPAPLVFADDDDEEGDGDDGFSLTEYAAGTQFQLTGEWLIDEQQLLSLSVEETNFIADGLTIEEFWIEAGKELAAVEAESEGVTEDEYEEFEQSMIDFLFGFFPPDILMQELAGQFDGLLFGYEVDGNFLTLIDDDIADMWRRVEPTAVPEITWAQVKAGAGQR